MKVRVWGCRGSVAAPGPDTMRYGGNTSCVEVRGDNGEAIVLDAGTGMRPLGVQMLQDGVKLIHIFLTHLHMDHLQGLGFFRPLFIPDAEVHVWGPPSPVQPLADRIATYMSPPLFPVRVADIPCNLTFHDAPTEPITIGGLTVRASLVTHQGPTVGYRVEEDGRSVVYLPTTSRASAASTSACSRPTGSAGTTSRTARRACCTTRSTATTSTRVTSDGATRRSATSSRSRRRPKSSASCCSITIRTTPTASSKSLNDDARRHVGRRRRRLRVLRVGGHDDRHRRRRRRRSTPFLKSNKRSTLGARSDGCSCQPAVVSYSVSSPPLLVLPGRWSSSRRRRAVRP